MVTITIEGGAELARRLNAMSVAAEKKILNAVLMEAAEPIRKEAERRAPVGEFAPHIAQNVVDVIPRGTRDERSVEIGPAKGFPYGLFLEFGTVKMAARPFLRPAFDLKARTALSIVQQRLWDKLRTAGGSLSVGGVGHL
jgi:HK97 gp10 family phage protein